MAAFALLCDALLSHKEASRHMSAATMVVYAMKEETAATFTNANVANAKDDVRSSLFRARKRTSDGKTRQAKFLICDGCFWCASLISIEPLHKGESRIVSCPACDGRQVESLPVSIDNNNDDDYDGVDAAASLGQQQ